MGVTYYVEPLNDKAKQYLESQGFGCTEKAAGRLATGSEILAAISEMDGFSVHKVSPSDSREMEIRSKDETTGAWAFLRVSKELERDAKTEFEFEGGWPDVIVNFLRNLAKRTGPWVVMDDSGVPLVVTPDKSLVTLMEEWESSELPSEED